MNQIWQIYVLIFVLQSSPAAFTPTFQATIPEVLPDEEDYTRARSLSRLAYDLENLLSPALAVMLLLVVSYHGLFLGTAVGFMGSALLVLTVVLPYTRSTAPPQSIRRKLAQGLRIYLATPRLHGLLALTLTASAGSALVIVNTVVIVREGLSRPETAVALALALALALAAFGSGSMSTALLLPRVLKQHSDRAVSLRDAGFVVRDFEQDELSSWRRQWRIPNNIRGCRPARLLGYFIEGHVTPEQLRRPPPGQNMPTPF